MGRANPKAWYHIESYIMTEMTIPQLHDGLESVLGLTVFKEDISFWNSVINDVTTENDNNEVAMGTYNSLHRRYVVSANTLAGTHKQTNCS